MFCVVGGGGGGGGTWMFAARLTLLLDLKVNMLILVILVNCHRHVNQIRDIQN